MRTRLGERLARCSVALGGQIVSLELPLRSRLEPVLLVVTDTQRGIILTDCLPLPELHAERYKPLLDYHSLLTGGQAALDVASKIGRSHLDAAIRRALGQAPLQGPKRENTALLLYSRENHAALRFDGSVVSHEGVAASIDEFLSDEAIEQILLLDVRATLRPDFWASITQQLYRVKADTEVIHWHSIVLEGMNRPYVAKPGLLIDPAFFGHDTLPLRAALLKKDFFAALWRDQAPAFRSGALRLEQVLAKAKDVKTVCVPLVLDTITWPTAPPMVAKLVRNDHLSLPGLRAPSLTTDASGVSVIINYRNSPKETLQCLRSLRAQEFSLPLEVILVNNLSTPENVELVTTQAREMFGQGSVQTVDFPYEFNHSAQCNIAAKVARHDLLFMLSNDSVILAPGALTAACSVAMVPWVGTVGFRIIGYNVGKAKLQSLGLGLSPRQMLFHGGSPLSTYRPPDFLFEFTQETLGNTFAAVVVRRESYLRLGGLDEVAFPTNYNDVDYCCRAMQQGLRHVAIGSAVVQHVGRGSREMDLDLPIDQRIVERCPSFARLTAVGIAQL
jgi:GT2 family glycosyltransferase